MSFDITSYQMGKKKGGGVVEIEGGEDYTFTDANNDGNVVVEKKEVVDNG